MLNNSLIKYRTKILKTLLIFLLGISSFTLVFSNNLIISNVSIEVNAQNGWTYVQFDITWENSWRTNLRAANWDAAWVFVKYRQTGGTWQHAMISSDATEHLSSAGANILAVPDSMGVFIYRETEGEGTVAFNEIKLAWRFASADLTAGEEIELKVLGVEMVYVPKGSFWVGDENSYNTFRGEQVSQPLQITTNPSTILQINSGTVSGDGKLLEGISIDGDGGICTSGTGVIDNSQFPTGYHSFYCMKYEASQQQYAEFLNMLTADQASARFNSDNIGHRYSLSGVYPNIVASAPDRACNFITYEDFAAYADWAGLRPMTELEYEKAGRGTLYPVANEYAWGTTNISGTCNVISNDGLANEITTSEAFSGNAAYKTSTENCGINGPLRTGIFAASSVNATREESGSGYYGIMELSGNVSEIVVSLSMAPGRGYTGLHGNGQLSVSGLADVENWPSKDNYSTEYRGGAWNDVADRLHISDRYPEDFSLIEKHGIRLIRSAPYEILSGISTSDITNISSNSATSGGSILAKGISAITSSGICWSTTHNPTINDNKTSEVAISGSFSSSITGLSPDTRYFVRAYAISAEGIAYGHEVSFTTLTPVTLPTLTTTAITDITTTTASSGGEITDGGGGTISARGVCWSTTTGPAITDNTTTDGTGIGTFVSSINGLSASTTYYLRAYATNEVGTAYGNEQTFTTSVLPDPTVTTDYFSSVTTSGADLTVTVTDNGGSALTSKGVCWSTISGPTVSDNTTDEGTGFGTFSSSITGLTANTNYYVRGYAVNNEGTLYGEEFTLKTMTGTVTDIDSNTYYTVTIGAQEWMAENLKVTQYPDSSAIPLVTDNTAWGNLADNNTDDSYCFYNNNSSSEYGALYTYAAALNACPTGWHLPSDAEWTELEYYLADNGYNYDGTTGDGRNKIAKSIATARGWNSSTTTGAIGNSDYPEKRNASGFSVLPGGYRSAINGTFFNASYSGAFWSNEEHSSANVYIRHLFSNIGSVWRLDDGKSYGFSVRCVKGVVISAPTVTTNPVLSPGATTATVGGEATDDGGDAITDRGIYFGTSTSPETTGTKLSIGAGLGAFSDELTGLSPYTTYYVKAFATNSIGTSYGSEETFITDDGVIVLTTATISDITTSTATSGGNITDDGGAPITARGVCWSTITGPTTTDNITSDVTGIGTFVSSITGLSASTTYYIRAYATNEAGTAYGDELTVKTMTGTVTDIDNNTYYTVSIGSQEWMAENLKVTQYPDSSAIPLVTDNTAWGNLADNNADDAYCYYNNNISSEYGALYSYAAALNACPTGWHLPSDAEWTELVNYLADNGYNYDGTIGGGAAKIAKAMATASGWILSTNTGAVGNSDYPDKRNASGFSGLPGGYRGSSSGTFYSAGDRGYWWSSTEGSINYAYARNLGYSYDNVARYLDNKSYGFSVRCVRDD